MSAGGLRGREIAGATYRRESESVCRLGADSANRLERTDNFHPSAPLRPASQSVLG